MAITLHLPMILRKAQLEASLTNSDVKETFYKTLDYYLNLIRHLHIKTFKFLANKKASINPLAFCQGGFYKGYLNPNDKLGEDFLRPMTMSFGITALNELQELWNKKSIVEDGAFVLEVMEHINKKVNEYKEKDGILYAIYGTPKQNWEAK